MPLWQELQAVRLRVLALEQELDRVKKAQECVRLRNVLAELAEEGKNEGR